MSCCCCYFSTLGYLVAAWFVFKVALFVYAHFFRAGKNLKKFGEWAVVTGATDGIGKAMAKELARKGLKVLLISRTQARLDEAQKEIETAVQGSVVKTLAIDYSNVTDADKKALLSALGDKEVGVLVNNVGMSYPYPEFFSSIEDKLTTDLVSLNVDSVLTMTRAVLAGMEKRKRGAIVNISSGSARFASPMLSEYSGTKGFVEMFSRGLAAEVAGKGVHVQVQSPLFVTTKLAGKKRPSLDTPTPDTYARAAVKYIGYETVSSPYWVHDLILAVLTSLPEWLVAPRLLALHLSIRKRALAKLSKEK